MCMMWRSSKTGFGRQSRGGIVIPRPSSGEASGMRAATAPMHVVIGRADQEPPPSTSSHAVFVRCGHTDWTRWDNAMTNPPNGSDYWWSNGPTLWQGNARTIFANLQSAGIRPVVTVRNRDNNGNPAWAPNPPVTANDWNVWWGHVFSTVYWLNVRNNYNVNDFEIHNEPNNSSQGWGGTESQYFTFA